MESFVIREEHRLRVLQNGVMRIFEPKWEEVTGDWKKFYSETLGICTSYHILFRQLNQGLHVKDVPCKGRREMHTRFW
jgi:hypothetical protein